MKVNLKFCYTISRYSIIFLHIEMNDLLTLIFSRFVLFNCPSFIDLGDLYAYIVAFTKLKIVYFMFVVVFVIFFTDRQHADKITTLRHKKRVNCCKRTIINTIHLEKKERLVVIYVHYKNLHYWESKFVINFVSQ